jgi:hypothetical protein
MAGFGCPPRFGFRRWRPALPSEVLVELVPHTEAHNFHCTENERAAVVLDTVTEQIKEWCKRGKKDQEARILRTPEPPIIGDPSSWGVPIRREEPSPSLIRNRSLINPSVPQPTPKQETIGEQIDRLRRECDDMTVEELAEKVELDPTNVSRHIRDKSKPTHRNRRQYQRVFSNILNRKIVINETQ